MRLTVLCAVLFALLAATADAAGPPPLSADQSRVDIASTFGGGNIGNWIVDDFGLPANRYTIDPATPQAA